MAMARSEQALTAQNVGVPTTDVMDFGDDAGGGLEDLRREEQATPFLNIIQPGSPQLKKAAGEYIPGSEQGMIFNNVTDETFDGDRGLGMIVCARHPHWGVWVPRELSGGSGGFRSALPPDHPDALAVLARMEEKYGFDRGRFNMPKFKDGRWSDEPYASPDTGDKLEIIETINLYVLWAELDDFCAETVNPAIIRFKSTAIPVYQGYIGRHKRWRWRQPDGTMKPGPLWLYRWRLWTKLEQRSAGDSYNWRLTLAEPARTFREAVYRDEDPKLFAMAEDFHAQFVRGTVKVDYESGDAVDPDAAPF
jgi:hypothetical protein